MHYVRKVPLSKKIKNIVVGLGILQGERVFPVTHVFEQKTGSHVGTSMIIFYSPRKYNSYAYYIVPGHIHNTQYNFGLNYYLRNTLHYALYLYAETVCHM